jgi:hypothetical protein
VEFGAGSKDDELGGKKLRRLGFGCQGIRRISTSEGLLHKSSCRFFVRQEFGRDLQSDRVSPEHELSRVFSDPGRFRHQLVRLKRYSMRENSGTVPPGRKRRVIVAAAALLVLLLSSERRRTRAVVVGD